MINLTRLDFSLLQLLLAVHDTGSVSLAGAKLGLSQPAASNALARLRAALGDPLFIRGAGGMVPTEYTASIVPQLRSHIAGIATALEGARRFEPAGSTRLFRLSLSGLGEQLFLAPLAREVAAIAPGVRLENISAPMHDLARSLAAREADVAIGILDNLDKGVQQEPLFDERYRAVTSAALPQGTRLDLHASRIILVAPSATYAEDIEVKLAGLGLTGNIFYRLRHFGALPELIQATGAVAIVPDQFAERLEASGAGRVVPLDLPLGRPRVRMVWHDTTTADPGCIWLRDLIKRLFQQPIAPES